MLTQYRERSHDVQDYVERHVYGELEYIDNGAIVKVRGTDSRDEEANVVNLSGIGFKLKKDSNAEVMLLAFSSDTNLKLALLTIPRDKQRRWAEGDGGIQHPTDPEFALDFSDRLAHITKNKFAVGEKGEFEVRGDTIYMRAKKVVIEGELVANIRVKTPEIVQGKDDIPGFQGNKQEEKKSSSDGATPAQVEMDFGDAA